MTQKPIRIDQILPSYAHHDAVGNHTSLTRSLLEKRGFVSEIFAESWSQDTKYPCRYYKEFGSVLSRESICIYQFSVGSPLVRFLYNKPTFKICSYHNITPHQYFEDWDHQAYLACLAGRRQLAILRNYISMTWSVSDFNKKELIDNCIQSPHYGFPVLRDYERLSKLDRIPELAEVMGNKKNLLFVGRITPHKGQFDLLFLLNVLKLQLKHGSKTRLVLVGSGRSEYIAALVEQARAMNLIVSEGMTGVKDCDVWLTGNVKDEVLAEIYRSSNLFISLSEHEGFGVPLVEAMCFGIPILAHDAAAIAETVGDGGTLVDKFNFPVLVRVVDKILSEDSLQYQMRQSSMNRSKNFSWERLENDFDNCLEMTLDRYHAWYKEQ